MDKPIILLENIHKSYGREVVLRGGTLQAKAGEMVCIIGENGSGKSTLLKIAMGLLKPDSGSIYCTDKIGYCPQDPVLYEYLTIDEHFQLFGTAYGLEKALITQKSEKLMETYSFKNYRNHKVHQLSGGTRQKLNLSLAILHDPQLLLLDEPYAGFDWDTYQCFLKYTQEATQQGTCIVMVTHLIYEKDRFSRIYKLNKGIISEELF